MLIIKKLKKKFKMNRLVRGRKENVVAMIKMKED